MRTWFLLLFLVTSCTNATLEATRAAPAAPARASIAAPTAPRLLAPVDAATGAPLPAEPAQPTPPLAIAHSWSEHEMRVLSAVSDGRPLVTRVYVPLCSSAQINCGARWAGNPRGLDTNVYWGAQFGARRHFGRSDSGWELVQIAPGDDDVILQRAIFRRRTSAAPWGFAERELEQLVVLEAIDGNQIEVAVERFWHLAQGKLNDFGQVRFVDANREREERVQIVGYAGHNRLMDGVQLSAPLAPADGATGLPSFVLACFSEKHFGAPLKAVGSQRLVLSQSYMAPEGYVIQAVVEALADNLPAREVRVRTMRAYAKWQRSSEKVASRILSPDLAP